MKTKVTKEQALKAILFMTVATTLSWPNTNLHHSVELASAGEVLSVDTASPQPTEDAKPLSMAPDTLMLPAGKVKMPVRPKPLGKNINPISKKPLLHSQGKVTICGVPLQLILDEKVEGNTVFTSVIIHEEKHPDGNELIAFPDVPVRANGTFADNGATKESIHGDRFKILKKQIEDAATAKMTTIGRCGDATDTAQPQPEEQEDQQTSEAPPTRRDDAAAIANCMINPHTHRALRTSDVLQCNIDKLDQLGKMDDGDSRSSSRVARELTRLIKNGIYPQLKNMLMSSNSDDQSRAQDMVDDLISKIEDMGSTYNISQSQITALTSSLHGLKAGGDAFQRATDMRQDVIQLRKDIQDARSQGGQNGQQGQVPQYLYQQLQDLQSKLQSEIAQGPIQELNQYSQYMQARDVKLFTAPYEQIQRELQAITGQQNGQGQNGQQIGQNGQQLGSNGQIIGGGQYGPNGQLIGGGQYGPNGQLINGGLVNGGIQYGPNGQIINGGIQGGYGVQGIQPGYGVQGGYGASYGAPGILGASYAPLYQQQLAYTNGGALNPQLLGQGSTLLGRPGSPWANQGLISNGAFQNAGIAASILPAQYSNSTIIAGGAAGSPFRNGSGSGFVNTGGSVFGNSGSVFGNSGSLFGGTSISGSIFGSGAGISAGISLPPPPPVSAGLYGGGFSGSGYYNRQLPVMTQSSRFPPPILPLANSSYGLTSTTSAVGTPFRR